MWGVYFWPTLFTEWEGTKCLCHSNSPRDTGRGQRGVFAREGDQKSVPGSGWARGLGGWGRLRAVLLPTGSGTYPILRSPGPSVLPQWSRRFPSPRWNPPESLVCFCRKAALGSVWEVEGARGRGGVGARLLAVIHLCLHLTPLSVQPQALTPSFGGPRGSGSVLPAPTSTTPRPRLRPRPYHPQSNLSP